MATPKTRHVLVLRPFLKSGKPIAKDAVVELDARFAAEIVTSNKGVYTEPPKPVEPAKAPEVKVEPARRQSKEI